METPQSLFKAARERQARGHLNEARRLYAKALEGFKQATARAPKQTDVALDYVHALRKLGRRVAAQEELRRFIEQFADAVEIHEELGDVCLELEDFSGAIEAYRHAIELQADRQSAREGLVQALMRRGNHSEALQVLESGLTIKPDDPRLLHLEGNALLAAGDFDAAARLFQHLITVLPDDPGPRFNLGICRIKQGQYPAARVLFSELATIPERSADARYYIALATLLSGDAAAALAGFDAVLSRNPLHINSLWYRGHCLRELGRHEEAKKLLDPDLLVGCQEPLATMSVGEREKLLGELAGYAADYPYQQWEPGGKTTRGGSQTTSLLKRGDPLMRGFEALIRRQVTAYLDRVAVPAPRPAQFGVELWATILRSGGHQKSHIHPGGWISGVFYCALPGLRGEGDAGWIEFGRPPYETETRYTPWTLRIRPQAGRMVWFPSWLPHATVPFESDQPRISLAFDLTPLP